MEEEPGREREAGPITQTSALRFFLFLIAADDKGSGVD